MLRNGTCLPSQSYPPQHKSTIRNHRVSVYCVLLILLVGLSDTAFAYCSNGKSVVLDGLNGTIADGSLPFQHSRPGSNCTWIIPISVPAASPSGELSDDPIVTVEVSHWEFNPLSRDRIEISINLSNGTSILLGSVVGFWFPAAGARTFVVTQRLASQFQDPLTQTSVMVRFVTDSQSPQFDGFFASWWRGPARMAGCPNSCFAEFGRGHCSSDQISCTCYPGFAGASCHNDDGERLIALYNQCGGPFWHDKDGWSLSNPTCDVKEGLAHSLSSWSGLSNCVAGRVTELSLRNNNLQCPNSTVSANGTAFGVPPLPRYLRALDLSENQIATFPSSISQLDQLNYVQLSKSGMSGQFPPSLATASLPLVVFNISGNSLSGSIPLGTIWIAGLLVLDVSSNQFDGFLPSGIAEMEVSESARVEGNRFLCPPPNWISLTSYTCTELLVQSINPQRVSMTGNSSIEIRSVGIPVSLPISCSFDDQSMVPASVIFSDQNATTPSSILCTTPTLSPGTHFVSIYVLGRRASMNQVALNVTIFCPQGTYLPSRRNIASSTGCLSCPFGALCVGGLEDPVSLPGFSPSPVVGKMFLECFVPESCVGNNTCGIGYVGPRCAFCAPSFVSVNGKCVICDSNASGWIAFGILLCVCLAPLWWLSRAVWNASSASFGNLLMFVQVIGLFDKYPLTWNPYLGGIVKAMSITILNTDYINLQCAFGLTYYPRLLLVWALPLIFGGIFLGYSWIFARFESKKHNRAFTESSQKWRRFSWNGFFSFLCLFHIPLTDRALKLFTCISDPYDDRFYIPGSPSVTCYDDKYFAYRPLAFVLSFVYGAGIPAFIFFTLFRHRKQLHEEQVVQRLSIVYSSYSESTWYWTPCQMMWSLVFMMLPVIFKRHPSYLMFISICLMYTYLFAVVYLKPYRLSRVNHLSIFSWITTIIFLLAGIILSFLSSTTSAQLPNVDDPTVSEVDIFQSTGDTPILATVIVLFYFCLLLLVHAVFYEYIAYSELKNPNFMGSQWGKRLRATFLWRSLFWRAKSAAERAVAKAAMIIERQHSKVDQNLPKLETNENGESKTSNAFPEDFGHLPSESSHQEEGAGGLSRRESFSQIVVEAAPTAKQGLLPVDDSSISGNREENGLGIVASIGGTFRRLLSMTWFTANDQHRADTFGNPYSMFDDEPLPPSGGNSAQNEKNANHSLKPRPKMISTSSDVLADIDGQDVEDNDDKNQFVIEDGH